MTAARSLRARVPQPMGPVVVTPRFRYSDELSRQQGQDRIAAAQRIDAGRDIVARKFVAEHPIAQLPDFVFLHRSRTKSRTRTGRVCAVG